LFEGGEKTILTTITSFLNVPELDE